MKICFRVDASIKMGTGHVMRCLSLAEEFKKNGHAVIFITRLHEGHISDLISAQGFEILALTKPFNYNAGNLSHSSWLGLTQVEDVIETKELILENNHKFDWVIVDHYALNKTWEVEIRKYIPKIMVLDDIADRQHDCDVLLDQNYYKNAEIRYKQLVPDSCNLLLGPEYAILRDEFALYYNSTKPKTDEHKILVFYGGSDSTNETLKAINAIKEINITNTIVHVVVGANNPNVDMIKKDCNRENFVFHHNIDYMAKLLYEVDFAVCAGGSFTWERYCIGTPAIVTAVANNQIESCENLKSLGIDKYIGVSELVTKEIISNEVKYFLNVTYKQREEKARKIVDGKGKIRIMRKIS